MFTTGNVWDYWPVFVNGLLLTIELSLIALAFGFVFGLFIGLARTYGPRPVRAICTVFTESFRSIPPLLLFFVTLTTASPLEAQSPNNAAITVVVSDPSDALVPGAAVTVTNGATGAVRLATTGQDGTVTLTALPLNGAYRIAVVLTGFTAIVRRRLCATALALCNASAALLLGGFAIALAGKAVGW